MTLNKHINGFLSAWLQPSDDLEAYCSQQEYPIVYAHCISWFVSIDTPQSDLGVYV